ncbi:DNA-directed RNA polymerases I and III subunit RPAC2 [Columba livia]|uniref:DNA-directed RNA polymerases I and III subunit RPAC2 n=1 Tax=Columba livia TaxID=8932 RepID=A0A2I0MAY6_COLLI|nr:DNA-directed RNA polymerases I and III subunit RPAC2 [Columba livia]
MDPKSSSSSASSNWQLMEMKRKASPLNKRNWNYSSLKSTPALTPRYTGNTTPRGSPQHRSHGPSPVTRSRAPKPSPTPLSTTLYSPWGWCSLPQRALQHFFFPHL